MSYAQVAVNVRLRRSALPAQPNHAIDSPEAEAEPLGHTFHYRVPPALLDRLLPGHLVIVPFGAVQAYGIVVARSQAAPALPLREIVALALPRPVVTAHQIALARWMADEYLTTLSHCLFAMLPPGLVRPPRAVYRLANADQPLPADLTGASRAVMDLLAREGSLRLSQIQNRLKLKRNTIRRALAHLRRRRLVTGEVVLPPPGGPARQVRFVRLLADDAAIAAAQPHLGHDSAQARVLRYLAATDDPLPTLEAVCRAAECSPSPVQALARRGWLNLTPRQETILPLLPADDLARLAGEIENRAPRQADALRYLAGHPGPLTRQALRQAVGVSGATLRALERAGAIERMVQEPLVWSALPPEEAQNRALASSGGQKQAAVLHLLQQRGEQLWVSWLYAETGCSLQDLHRLEALGLIELAGAEEWRDPQADRAAPAQIPPPLTPDQAAAWAEMQPSLIDAAAWQPSHSPPVFLLHGVTGSGKTELYLRALAEVLASGRQGMALVPEISLTAQTVRRFTARFPGRVAVYHSALGVAERQDVWRRARDGLIDVVVGPRSALFLPLPRLGLILLDEEHDASYKQPREPHFHTRDAAVRLAELTGAVVVLGSATPDVTSYHAARQGRYRLLSLPRRILAHGLHTPLFPERTPRAPQVAAFAGMPPVEIVDLRAELRAGNRSLFSRALQQALTETLARDQQAILFLNRRGAATLVNCRDCGQVLCCTHCDVPLTYHSSDGWLVCHHCGRRSSPPERCPACGGPHIRYFGIGTQRVETALQERFPGARVLRWDRDTVGARGAHEKFLQTFVDRRADVLVGTQMVAKGLDLPWVTLVGVIAADTALHLPDYRAAERTFQLLGQVAGRAGRSALGGRVVVQTYSPEVYAVQFAARHDYAGFFQQELAFRQRAGYPPFYRLASLRYAHAEAAHCQAQAEAMRRTLEHQIARLGLAAVSLIGPAPCFVTRVRGRYRWQIVVRAAQPQELLRHVELPLGWQVEIDPVSLL
ncbi:MAG: replication restart helicase PriA [Chloroflexota bacterium]